MAMYNIKPDPSTAFVRNAYHRVGITDLDKIRDSAFDNVNKGISTILHLHTHGDEARDKSMSTSFLGVPRSRRCRSDG